MASLIGGHYTKNGIKQLPARTVLSMNGVGLGGDETHLDTITILRDTRVFPDGEAPPDFNSYDGSDWVEYGKFWYEDAFLLERNFKNQWNLNPADYYQICNEQGGNDPWALQRLVDIERAISQAANADGRKCCVLNLAGGTPGDFELWKQIIAPFILEAWQTGGNIYGRHCYADKFVNDDGSIVPGQPQRIINELEYLKSIGYGGGMVLTECGLYGGYGVAEYGYFEQQITAWEAVLRPYADIFIGLCWWEMGESGFKADYTAHVEQLVPYLEGSYLEKWEPPTVTPPDNGQGENMEYEWLGRITTTKAKNYVRTGFAEPLTATHVRVNFHKTDGNGKEVTFASSELGQIPDGTTSMSLTQYFEYEDEPENPNPPPAGIQLQPGDTVVDLSYWNNVDLAVLKANEVKAVMLRTSNGIRKGDSSEKDDSTDESGIDKRFLAYAKKATEIGLPFGVTHFQNDSFDDIEQLDHFRSIVLLAATMGYFPTYRIALNYEETSPNTEARLKAAFTYLAANKPAPLPIMAYSRKWWWDAVVPASATWPKELGLYSWQAAYLSSTVPPTDYPPVDWKPWIMNGFDKVSLWQWTSLGGFLVGHTIVNLDLNLVDAIVPDETPPTPPPTGQVYDTSFMRAEPGIWRVVRRSDGSGEDVWELPLDSQNDVRVKNTNEGEWYFYGNGGIWRTRDTSMAPAPDGTPRLYLLNDGNGGQIAPNEAEVGKVYSYTSEVNVKAKADCADLVLNSGTAVTKFRLKAVIPNYTFPGTGFKVDWLYVVDGGSDGTEVQLYAIHEGRKYGWCGGGANIGDNVWGGELNEVYFDRAISQTEPKRYC